MNVEQAIKIIECFFRESDNKCANGECDFASPMCQYDREAAFEITLSALREKAERENPKPLTLEELKDRHGKPIYAVDGEGHACWVVVNAFDEECADNEFGAWQFFYYDMQDCTKDELHPMGWLAYDHEPKEAHK